MIYTLNRVQSDAQLTIAAGYAKPAISLRIAAELTCIFCVKGREELIYAALLIGWQEPWIAALLWNLESTTKEILGNVSKEIKVL